MKIATVPKRPLLVAEPQSDERRPHDAEAADTSLTDVLLIDDDQGVRTALSEALARCGYSVCAVGSGRAALAQLARNRFRLVITDIFMPELDGLELIMKYIAAHPGGQILAMAGHCGYSGTSTILKMAEILGCRRTIVKPFSLFDFLEMVYQLLHDKHGNPAD